MWLAVAMSYLVITWKSPPLYKNGLLQGHTDFTSIRLMIARTNVSRILLPTPPSLAFLARYVNFVPVVSIYILVDSILLMFLLKVGSFFYNDLVKLYSDKSIVKSN